MRKLEMRNFTKQQEQKKCKQEVCRKLLTLDLIFENES